MYRWAVEASTYVKEANKNKGRETESNAIRSVSFQYNKYQGQKNNLYTYKS